MKKVLFALLVSVFCLTALSAQEEAEDSMFSPSVSIENELTLPFAKQGEDKSKGNVELNKGEIENKTTAKFGVGIAVAENFGLNAYAKDALKFGAKGFSSNEFTLGLGMEFVAMEILTLSADLAYINNLGGLEGEVEVLGKKIPISSDIANGFQFALGLATNVEAIFLEAEMGYKVKGLLAKKRFDTGADAYANLGNWKHTINLIDAKMDFFNFIKEGLNSGLTLSDELNIEIKNANTPSNKDFYSAKRKITNEFTVGLHFAPLEFMDTSLGVTVTSETVAKWDDGKYVTDEGSLGLSLPIGLEFSKGMFTFGVEYTPTLMKNTHEYKDGKFEKTEKENNLEQELKLAVSVKL